MAKTENRLTEQDKANLKLLSAIERWHNNKRLHPITCGDISHGKMKGEVRGGKVKLVCGKCGAVRDDVPEIVADYLHQQR